MLIDLTDANISAAILEEARERGGKSLAMAARIQAGKEDQLKKDFMLAAIPQIFYTYVDASLSINWDTQEWHERTMEAAHRWDADGRPTWTSFNRCACGRRISKNKTGCLKCGEALEAAAVMEPQREQLEGYNVVVT